MGIQQSSEADNKRRRDNILSCVIIGGLFALSWVWDAISPYLPQSNMGVMEQSFLGTMFAILLCGWLFVRIAEG